MGFTNDLQFARLIMNQYYEFILASGNLALIERWGWGCGSDVPSFFFYDFK